jgi:hypothetical protein
MSLVDIAVASKSELLASNVHGPLDNRALLDRHGCLVPITNLDDQGSARL